MKTRLTRNLQFGFGLSLLFLVIISAASYLSIHNLFESADLVDHSNLVIKKLEFTASVMKDAETGERGFLLTGNDKFLEPYNGSYQKAVKSVEAVRELTRDNPQMQLLGDKIKDILTKRLTILQVLIEKKEVDKPITTEDLNKSKLAMDSLRSAINDAETTESRLLQIRLNSLKRYTSITPLFLVFATVISIIITVFSYFRVMGEVEEKAKLHEALAIKEHETAAANEELAAANEEMSAANEEISAANEELIDINVQLNESRESVQQLNETLAATNEELSATIDELYLSQNSLKSLNEDLEERVLNRTKALSESESQFRVMMETLPQVAWTNNTTGEINFFNKQWYDYTGLAYEQSKDWGWTSVIHPDDLSRSLEKYRTILESGIEGEFEMRERDANDNYRWHLIRMQPVESEAREVRLWVGTATDIQELKNLQQQKDDFISIASHELKTPITSLKVSLQLLDRIKHNHSAQVFPKMVEQANKSLDKVNILIEDLLNVSKLNQGQLHLNKTPFIISRLIDDCCQHVRIDGLYSIVVTGDKELKAYGDADRIEQVLVNFVNNAIKYAPDSKEILVDVKEDKGRAKISVSDKGPGIPADKVAHLFERYYRVDSTGVQFSGLGLGLYISSEIIKKHGGQIGVDTKPGEGSTFWFTLPLKN